MAASLVNGLLLALGLLNLALIMRFYRRCFFESHIVDKQHSQSLHSHLNYRRHPHEPETFDTIAKHVREEVEKDVHLQNLLHSEAAKTIMEGFPSALELTDDILRVSSKSEIEIIRMKGALLFQQALYEKQFEQCNQGKRVALYRLTKNHRYGFFSQVQGIANSLLNAFAHGYVLSWENTITFYVDPDRCPSRNFECLFKPITSCSETQSYTIKDNVRNSCFMEFPRSRLHEQPFVLNSTDLWQDMVEVLRQKSGINALGHPEIFNAHFFVREAIRFVMRPNAYLKQATKDILKQYFPIPKNWSPLRNAVSRVAVHIRAGEDKKAHTGVLGPEFYVKSIQRLAAQSVRQVLISSDNEAFYHSLVSRLKASLKSCEGGEVEILSIPFAEFSSNSTISSSSVLESSTRSRYDTGTLLTTQAYIFASSDAFFGFYGSNVATTIAALMSALRFSSQETPSFDVGGSPWCVCNHLKQYPLRNLKHPSLK